MKKYLNRPNLREKIRKDLPASYIDDSSGSHANTEKERLQEHIDTLGFPTPSTTPSPSKDHTLKQKATSKRHRNSTETPPPMEKDYTGIVKPEPAESYDDIFQQHKRLNLTKQKVMDPVIISSSDEDVESEPNDLMSTILPETTQAKRSNGANLHKPIPQQFNNQQNQPEDQNLKRVIREMQVHLAFLRYYSLEIYQKHLENIIDLMEILTKNKESIVRTFREILKLSGRQGPSKYIAQLEQFATTDLDLI